VRVVLVLQVLANQQLFVCDWSESTKVFLVQKGLVVAEERGEGLIFVQARLGEWKVLVLVLVVAEEEERGEGLIFVQARLGVWGAPVEDDAPGC